MKKVLKRLGDWLPIVLLTLGTLWVIQGALAKTSSHGVIVQGLSYDAGTVKAGAVITDKIRVTNLSAEPVEINAQPGCGCTVVDVPEKPVAPLHSETIKVTVDTDGMEKGEQQRGVTIRMESLYTYWQSVARIKFDLQTIPKVPIPSN